jgi:hypothetical protein
MPLVNVMVNGRSDGQEKWTSTFPSGRATNKNVAY